MSSKLVQIQPLAAPPGSDPSTKPPPTAFFAVITTIDADRPDRPVDPGWGVTPPDPGHPWLPGAIGGGIPHPSHPIYRPDKPTPQPPDPNAPPGTIWPPIEEEPPAAGFILVWIPGVGYRWIKVDKPTHPPVKPPEGGKPPRHRPAEGVTIGRVTHANGFAGVTRTAKEPARLPTLAGSGVESVVTL